MRFVETPVFTKSVASVFKDEQYRALQSAPALRPAQGALIRGSGGLRKLRWVMPGRGKRGGVRVIYYWDAETRTCHMLLVHKKSEQGDLTPEQIRILGRLVREEFK